MDTTVTNILREPTLGARERVIVSYIVLSGEVCHYSQAELAKHLGLAKASTERDMLRLMKMGVLRRVKLPGKPLGYVVTPSDQWRLCRAS